MLQKIQLRPGVNREGTNLSNEGGWFEGDKIRFRSGFPEKIGGWAAVSYARFLGVARSLWNWVTLKNYNLLGIGTSLKFYIENGGVYYDITPIRRINGNTPSAGPPIVTASTIVLTASGTVLTVSDSAAESLQVNDFVTLAGAGTIGGVNVNREYQIDSVISSTSYTVTLTIATTGSNAASTITLAYQISTGSPIYSIGTGWGSDSWPLYTELSLTNPFTATGTGISVLTVTTPSAHNLTTGDYVSFAGTVGVGGISSATVCGINSDVLEKTFQVTVTGATTFTISTVIGTLTYLTSSTAASGGTVTMDIPNPLPTTVDNVRGWSSGFSTGFGLQLRLWSQTNFGEQLLFNPRGSALYNWNPGSGATPAYGTRGVVVSGNDVPAIINQVMVSDAARIVICFGCNDYGAYGTTGLDPLLIRWSAQESFADWTPDATNQAGSYRLSRGSYINSALQTRQEILIWTDAAVYSMQYLGPPFVYGFNILVDNVSIISPNAMATASGVTYWMGVDKFYTYSGRVETLPCSVRTYIFNDIDPDQNFQVVSGTNEGFSEVWWFYCSTNSIVPDKYVIFNYLDRVWYYGSLTRTAWLDSPLRQFPQAATSGNLIVDHEFGVDDGETNPPSPIHSYIQSSDFDIGDGYNYGFVWQMIPDITFDGSDTQSGFPTVNFTVRPRQNPGANYNLGGSPVVQSAQSYAGQSTYNVQQFTEIVYTRVRGRQMALKVESSALGTQWQLGTPRINVRPDGRKG